MTTKLLREGRKLAVLGCRVDGSKKWWHIAKAGRNVPQICSSADHGSNLVISTSLCNKTIYTNGYAADFRPPEGALCPACAERN